MPSKSQAQQRLMGMAWAIRKGELKKKDANPKAVELAKSKMKDKDMKAFASTKHKNLPDYIHEQMVGESKTAWINMKRYAESWLRQEWKGDDMKMVILNTLEGFWAAVKDRMSAPNLTEKEKKDTEEIAELLQKLSDIVNE